MISAGNGRGRTCCCVVKCRSMPRAISKCRTARVSLTNRTNELDCCRGDEDDSADPIHRLPNLFVDLQSRKQTHVVDSHKSLVFCDKKRCLVTTTTYEALKEN